MRRSILRAWLAAVLGLALIVPAAADDRVTLTMWHNHPEWKGRVEAILAKFEAQHPNIHIELTEITGASYAPRVNTALAAGEAPDIIPLNGGPETAAAARAGYTADLTDLLDVSSLTPSALSASKVDGRLFGVPVLGEYTVGLYYQRDIFAKYGLKPPATWDELFDVAKKLKASGVTPMIVPAQDGIIPSFLYMLAASSVLGADGVDAIRAGTRKFTDPDVLKASYFLRDLYPYFQDGALGTPYVEGKALFALGRGAMLEGGSADYAGFTTTNPKVNVGVVPFPAGPGGKPSTVTGMQGMFCINKKTAHQKEAVTFLQWMLGKEPAQMVVDTITLSTSKDVLPSDNRVMTEMVQASRSNDVRVWYEFPQIQKVFSTIGVNSQPLFLGEMTPEAFAQKLQDVVDTSAK